MFGTPANPFGGQPSTSPFSLNSSSSAFGTNNSANPFAQPANPFAPKPFGSSTGLFGGTATGVFGAASQPAFGSTAAFGSSTPAFGTTPASPFGSANAFGQKPATPFGTFGASPGQANPFGTTTFGQAQPSQPAFGATTTPAFGAAPAFGATSTPAFGATTTPAFGATAAPVFGATTTPAFGAGASAPAFGAGQPASTPAFGSTGFGATGAFGQQPVAPPPPQQQQQQQQRGSRVTPYQATGDPDSAAGQPAKFISISAMQAYKTKSVEELRWEDYQQNDKGGPAPAGQARPAGSIFGAPPQSNPFGGATTFGSTTPNPNPFGAASSPNPFASSTPAFGSTTTPAFGATAASSPVFGSTSSSLFGAPAAFGTTAQQSSPAFGLQPSTSVFGSAPASTPAFGSTSVFGSTSGSTLGSGLFGATTSAFGTTGGAFGAGLASSTPAFGGATPSPAFGSSSPAFGATTSLFGSTPSPFGATTPAFGQSSTPAFGSSPTPFGQTAASSSAFGSTSLFGNATSGFNFSQTRPAGLTASTPASSPSPFGGFTNPATNTGFGFNTQPQGTAGLSTGASLLQQPLLQAQQPQQLGLPGQQVNIFPTPVANPFGYMPAVPQVNVGRSWSTTPSKGQSGIGSMPVSEKPVQTRGTSLLTPRHITPRSRVRMHARRYQPQSGSTRVSFLSDGEEVPTTPRADVLFVPRENPRALFIRHPDQSATVATPSRTVGLSSRTIASPAENGRCTSPPADVCGDGAETRAVGTEMQMPATQSSPPRTMPGVSYANGTDPRELDVRSRDQVVIGDRGGGRTASTTKLTTGTADERTGNGHASHLFAADHEGDGMSAGKRGTDIEALLPKLQHPEYYTEPKIQELAAKERASPGYTSRVKDFVIGRRGYGSVRFLGETDVRGLDLEGIVQFNKCEVLVYMDESKKPPIGRGLNKPAEVTLLNVKCVDKKSGQVLGGPEVEKFERKLKRKTEEQGAEFVKYDAVKGEWAFRVQHFSQYGVDDCDEDV